MENEFVPYDIALAMKELGFDEPCFGYYDGNHNLNYMFEGKPENFSDRKFALGHSIGWVSAPLYQQAFRWFREKYNMKSAIKFTHSKYSFDIHFERLANGENPPVMVWHLVDSWLGLNLDLFETYEEAELACLRKLIEEV